MPACLSCGVRVPAIRLAVVWLCLAVPVCAQSDSTTDVRPFLKLYCAECHTGTSAEAELDVTALSVIDFTDRRTREHWSEIVNALNSHAMPPESALQPSADDTADVIDWATRQLVTAELNLRENTIVLRRMNRNEYRNSIRELTGVDFDVTAFPQDPAADGFDNNGAALTLSPLHIELFYDAAQQILDRALVEGDRPPVIRWRFEPETGDNDNNRVEYDGQRAIVNGGNNPARDGYRIIHHANWDKTLNARDFALPTAGDYIVRIRAAGMVPQRAQVVDSARAILQTRLDKQRQEAPDRERWHVETFERDLEHFHTDRVPTSAIHPLDGSGVTA